MAGLDAVAKERILRRMGAEHKSFGHIMLHVLLGRRGEEYFAMLSVPLLDSVDACVIQAHMVIERSLQKLV
jgi:hypothetical protein